MGRARLSDFLIHACDHGLARVEGVRGYRVEIARWRWHHCATSATLQRKRNRRRAHEIQDRLAPWALGVQLLVRVARCCVAPPPTGALTQRPLSQYMITMRKIEPDLRFGPGTSCGFTPAGVAAFDNLRPAAVVRELLQNALDAARTGAISPAVVEFRLSRINCDEIPGIKSYRTAFEKAVATQKSMTGGALAAQANLVVERIRRALAKENLDVLSVLDNGVGLNEHRMNALLSDGVSAKGGDATGTYGNGHATAIPASDLRYVLYGGVTDDNSRIGAGHAVLASYIRAGERHPRAGDGFYICDFHAAESTLFRYATGSRLPPLISDALEAIHDGSVHGTAVIIPAFNNFLEEQSLWEMVSYAASANFFVAIEDGDLEVVVVDHRAQSQSLPTVLNKSNLTAVLQDHQNKQRTTAFLSGRRAFEAHKAYQSGRAYSIATTLGGVEIRLFDNPTGVVRVDLCRNGMWITDDKKIPGFYQKFNEQAPFHAVLTLDARTGRELHDYIRIAEGPLHDSITIKRLPRQQRKDCRIALREIVGWIKENTPHVQSEAYVPSDYLTLDFGEDNDDGRGALSKVYWGTPVVVNRSPARQLRPLTSDSDLDDGDENNLDEKRPKGVINDRKRPRARPSLPSFFRVASRPAGNHRRKILIECTKLYTDAEVRLVVDEALDATCERPGQDNYLPAVLTKVTINGKPARKPELVRWGSDVVGIRLGDLHVGAVTDLEMDYRLTGDFENLTDAAMRVEVFKTTYGKPQDLAQGARPGGTP